MILHISLIGLVLITSSFALDYSAHGAGWDDYPCASGASQSPINITPSIINSDPNCRYVDIKYPGAISTYSHNDGHSLKSEGSFIEVDIHDANGAIRQFQAAQFHLHAKSEHTIDGKQFDLELHIVCKQLNADAATKYAVFGIFFEITEDEMEEASFFKQYKFPTTGPDSSNYQIDFKAIMNLVFINGQKLYTYEGSLTTPPCNEIVSWHVFKNPLKITKENYEKFKELWYDPGDAEMMDGNWRKTYPLNGRTVTLSKFCSSSYLLKLTSVVVFLALLIF